VCVCVCVCVCVFLTIKNHMNVCIPHHVYQNSENKHDKRNDIKSSKCTCFQVHVDCFLALRNWSFGSFSGSAKNTSRSMKNSMSEKQ
jgi:hypothetical protein